MMGVHVCEVHLNANKGVLFNLHFMIYIYIYIYKTIAISPLTIPLACRRMRYDICIMH